MRELTAYLFLVSLLITGLATPIAIRMGNWLGVLDNPGPRKIHQTPIPLVGGWALFACLTLVLWGHILGALAIRGTSVESWLEETLQSYVSISPMLAGKVLPIYFGLVVIFITGIIDDIRGLSVKVRLLVQVGVAGYLAFSGIRPSLSFLPTWMAMLIGIIWIVGITNSFNFLDGLDGLSTGVALVASLSLLTILGITMQPDLVFLLATLSGALLGFLRFNYHPAKAFLGSSGSLFIGYLMGVITLLVTYMNGAGSSWLMPLLTPVFVMAIPLYDTFSVMMIRILQKRSIATGDQSHFHHRLMKLGFSHRQTVSFMVLIAFSVALSAVRLVQATFFQSMVILIQILSLMLLVILAERVVTRVRNEAERKRQEAESLDFVSSSSGSELH